MPLEDLSIAGSRDKATYEEIQDCVLEHTGLKVSTFYIA